MIEKYKNSPITVLDFTGTCEELFRFLSYKKHDDKLIRDCSISIDDPYCKILHMNDVFDKDGIIPIFGFHNEFLKYDVDSLCYYLSMQCNTISNTEEYGLYNDYLEIFNNVGILDIHGGWDLYNARNNYFYRTNIEDRCLVGMNPKNESFKLFDNQLFYIKSV